MRIEVVGSGCARCQQLYELTKAAAAESGVAGEVVYITDPVRLGQLGVMTQPVVVIDDEPVLAGEIPDKQAIIEAISGRG